MRRGLSVLQGLTLAPGRLWPGRAGRPAAFWSAAASGLVLALVASRDGEAVLLDCASVPGPPLAGQGLAPGLLECAAALGAMGLKHYVAIGAEHCRLVQVPAAGPAEAGASAATLVASISGSSQGRGLAVEVPAPLIAELGSRFAAARMTLAAVDAAPAALMSLADYLGLDGPPDHPDPPADPLASVSLLPSCQASAVALGAGLAVPLGMALSRLGLAGNG